MSKPAHQNAIRLFIPQRYYMIMSMTTRGDFNRVVGDIMTARGLTVPRISEYVWPENDEENVLYGAGFIALYVERAHDSPASFQDLFRPVLSSITHRGKSYEPRESWVKQLLAKAVQYYEGTLPWDQNTEKPDPFVYPGGERVKRYSEDEDGTMREFVEIGLGAGSLVMRAVMSNELIDGRATEVVDRLDLYSTYRSPGAAPQP